MQAERGEDDKPNFLVQAQAKLLNCVGMMYSGDEDLTRLAKSYHYQLVSFCGDNWTNGALETEEILRNNSNSVGRKWKAWYEAESRRRTGYCIWVSSTTPLGEIEKERASVASGYLSLSASCFLFPSSNANSYSHSCWIVCGHFTSRRARFYR